MRQIVYFSTAAGRQDPATIAEICAVASDHNLREKVTGLLVAGGHRYLQVIEGPIKTVEALMDRIRRDQRHVSVTVLVNRRISARSLSGWSTACYDEPELSDYDTFRQMVERMRAEVPERHLREQLDCFERLFAVATVPPIVSPWTLVASYEPGLTLDRRH